MIQFIISRINQKNKILIIQPRKITAESLSKRISEEMYENFIKYFDYDEVFPRREFYIFVLKIFIK